MKRYEVLDEYRSTALSRKIEMSPLATYSCSWLCLWLYTRVPYGTVRPWPCPLVLIN